MKIFRVLFLVAILSLGSWFWSTPEAWSALTKEEATYAKCQEVERYYTATPKQVFFPRSELDSVDTPIVIDNQGYFWSPPNDIVLLPSEEASNGVVAVTTKAGAYIRTDRITCDLERGAIAIDLTVVLPQEGQEPFTIKQIDEMWWDEDPDYFKGKIFFPTEDGRRLLEFGSDFAFLNCNQDGLACTSINMFLVGPVPETMTCQDFALTNYGIKLKHPNEIASCTVHTEIPNYFYDRPSKTVVVFVEDGQEILGAHLQVTNNIWLEVAYRDRRVFEYRGVSCFLKYTSNAQQNWENPDIERKFCSPRKIIQIR